MSYCLNPRCRNPRNTDDAERCLECGSILRLKERYRAIEPIGQGGFGKTFLAIDEDLPSKPYCVIKLLLPRGQERRKAEELFNREAIQLEKLGSCHDQIPDLLAHSEKDFYLVQEFVDGQNLLLELKNEGAFDENKIRELLNDLLAVLQFIHEQRVIHRDIKPENIIRRRFDQKLVLVDFGLSKFVTETGGDTGSTIIGHRGYAAPEQYEGRSYFSSDLFSLGATCFHLMTKINPAKVFAPNKNSKKYLDININKTLSSELLKSVLKKMLHEDVSQRYRSASEALKDLNSLPVTIDSVTKNINNPISGEDLVINLELSFQEALSGGDKIIDINRLESCEFCHGFGGFHPSIGGRYGEKCIFCDGTSIKKVNRSISLPIPSKVQSGACLRFSREGNAGRYGGLPGDLCVHLIVRKPPTRGNDLRLDLRLTFREAVFGCEPSVPINHLETCDQCEGLGYLNEVASMCLKKCSVCNGNGRKRVARRLTITIPAGVDDGMRLRVEGEGDAGQGDGSPGDLYIYLFTERDSEFSRDGLDILATFKISRQQAVLGGDVVIQTLDGPMQIHIPPLTWSKSRFKLDGLGVPHLKNPNKRGDFWVTVLVG
jgi:DnaJ-class molecular chaperone